MLVVAARCAAVLNSVISSASASALLAVALIHSLGIAALNPFLDTLAPGRDPSRRRLSLRLGRGIGPAALVFATLASGFVVNGSGLASVIFVFSPSPSCAAPFWSRRPIIGSQTMSDTFVLGSVLATTTPPSFASVSHLRIHFALTTFLHAYHRIGYHPDGWQRRRSSMGP